MTSLLLTLLASGCATSPPPAVSDYPDRTPAARIIVDCQDLFQSDKAFTMPHGQGPVSKPSYYYGLDTNGNQWVSGRTFFSTHLVEVWLEGPGFISKSQLHEQIVDYLSQHSLSDLPGNRIGFEIHVREKGQEERIFQIVDWNKVIEIANNKNNIAHPLRHLAEDFIALYSQRYLQGPPIPGGQRFRISPEIVARTQEITRSCLPRTTFLVASKKGLILQQDQSFVRLLAPKPMDTPYGKLTQGPPGFTQPEHFDLTGGMAIVFSKGPSEPFPTETLHQRPRPRPEGEHWAELTRYVIEENSHERHYVSTEMLETAIALIAGRAPAVKKILVDVNGHHSQKYLDLGFEIVDTFIRFDGEVNYHMVGKTSVALERIREKKLADQHKRLSAGEAPPAQMDTQPQDLFNKHGIVLVSWGISGHQTSYPYFFFGELKNRNQLYHWMGKILDARGTSDQKAIVFKAMIEYLTRSMPDLRVDFKEKSVYSIALETLASELDVAWKNKSAGETLEDLIRKILDRKMADPAQKGWQYLRGFFLPPVRGFPPNFLAEVDSIRKSGQSEAEIRKALKEFGHSKKGMDELWGPLHGDQGIGYFVEKVLDPRNAQVSSLDLWKISYKDIQLWKKQRWGQTQDEDIAREKRVKALKVKQEEERSQGKYAEQNVIYHPKVNEIGPFLNDSQMIVTVDGRLRVYDLTQKRLVKNSAIDSAQLPRDVKSSTRLLVTVNKNFLMIIDGDWAVKLDLRSGKVEPFPSMIAGNYREAKLTRDGKYLLLGGDDGKLIIFEWAENRFIYQRDLKADYCREIQESPDERWIFFAQPDGKQVLFDRKQGKVMPFPDLKVPKIHHVVNAAFSYDSKILTIANHNEQLYDFHLETGTLKPSRYSVHSKELLVTADARYLVFTRDIAYSSNPLPFQIFDQKMGAEITPDLSQYRFDRPIQFYLDQESGKLFFTDTIKKDRETVEENLFVFDFNTLTFKRWRLDPQSNFGVTHVTPDGKRFLGAPPRNGGIYELN